MKVSIITEGLKDTGYGHLMRCLSLTQAFEEKYILPTLYINSDESCNPILGNRTNIKIIDWLKRPAQLLSFINNSDILIVDSYLAGKEFYDNIYKRSRLNIFIDDNMRIDYPEGTILNSTILADSLTYKTKNDALLGLKYVSLRKEFWNVPARKINQKVSVILLTFGGQDNQNLTPSVMTSIQEKYPDLKLTVVIGQAFKNATEIEKQKGKNTYLYYSPAAEQMLKLILESDIVISAAGQTLYELAVTGTPSVSISVVENQKQNLIGWKKKGFLLDTIYHTDVNYIKKILEQLEKLQSISLRKKLSKIGRANVDGKGALRVVEFILNKYCDKNLFYIRFADITDSKIVFDLSNDPSVRSQSINPSSITWESHQEWFAKTINDNNYFFFLAFDKKNDLIGQIRFQVEKENAIVSISIKSEYRGKGLSKKILADTCSRVFSLSLTVKKIIAYILPDNSPSINGFKSAGFILAGNEPINEKIFLKFILEKK
jgi:spore coat polysaccharide biosynthesis predicted glycosyltransferase SpsG/RimJ/RimL family protein N-acetyltransferase